MQERLSYPTAPETKGRKLFLQLLPPSFVAGIACRFIGKGLVPEELSQLKNMITRMVQGEHICISKEAPSVLGSQRSKMHCEGEKNIPSSGATIVIGNHYQGGLLHDMGPYFEAACIVHDGRTAVEDESVREPYALVQRGFNYAVRVGRLRVHIPLSLFFTGQFYELVIRSIGWEFVLPPKFDNKGQITNRQGLSPSAIRRLETGGAMIWLPQGQHTNHLEFPEKAGDFLFRMRDKDIQLVPLRVIRKDQDLLYLLLGKPIHVQDLPEADGTVDINDFVQTCIAPLGRNMT